MGFSFLAARIFRPLLLLIPVAAEFVIKGVYGDVELLSTDSRRVSLEVLADHCR